MHCKPHSNLFWLGLCLLVLCRPVWGIEACQNCKVTVSSFDKHLLSKGPLNAELMAAAKVHDMEAATIQLYKSGNEQALEEQLRANTAMKDLIRRALASADESVVQEVKKKTQHDYTDVMVETNAILFISSSASGKVGNLNGPVKSDLARLKTTSPLAVGFVDLRRLLDSTPDEGIDKKLQSKTRTRFEEVHRSIKSLRDEVAFAASGFRNSSEIEDNKVRTSKINQAAKSVAISKHLDLIVDISQVWSGADKLRQHGCDMTELVIDEMKHNSIDTAGNIPSN